VPAVTVLALLAAMTTVPLGEVSAASVPPSTDGSNDPVDGAGADLERVLRELGVEIADEGVGAGPFMVARASLDGLATDMWRGVGLPGSIIDELAPVPDGLPRMSSVIAGWLTSGETPRAVWAGHVLAGKDWAEAGSVTFPVVVVNMFVADVLRTVDGVDRVEATGVVGVWIWLWTPRGRAVERV
jgi:hypothetical protein